MDILLRELEPGASYVVQLRATDGTLYSEWSSLYEFLTEVDTVSPAPVTALSWTVQGTAFLAAWTAPTTNEDGSPLVDFKDYKVTVSNGIVTRTYFVTQNRFDFSFEQNKAAFGSPAAQVFISVYARDTSENVSTDVSTSATNPAPGMPTNLLVSGQSDAVLISWDAPADDDIKHYEVHVSTAGTSFTPTSGTLKAVTSATSYTYPSSNYVTHYVKIIAVDVFGSKSVATAAGSAAPYNSVVVDSTAPAAPTNVTVAAAIDTTDTSGSSAYIDVSWNAVAATDLAGYRIRYSTSSSGPWTYLDVDESVTSARIRGLVAGQSYYIAVSAFDWQDNPSAYTNASVYPRSIARDAVAPSTPAAPTASASAMYIQVVHTLKKSDGVTALEEDLDFLEVHVGTTSGFSTSAATVLGTIKASRPSLGISAIESFYYPQNDTSPRYIKVIAVDLTGNRSLPSIAGSVTPGLIDTANIKDLAVTDGKVANLSATKLVADTAFTNNLFVRSQLTIDAVAGKIQSSNFNAATQTGFQLGMTGLTIYDGTVAAKALLIQEAANIMPAGYAGLEFLPSWYTTNLSGTNGTTFTYSIANPPGGAKFGSASLRVVNTSGTANKYVFFSPTSSTYNIPVEGSTTYIFSAYIYNDSGAARDITLGYVMNDNGSTVTSVTSVPAGVWTRVSCVATTNAATTAVVLAIGATQSLDSTYYIDGIQLERKVGALNTPSPFKFPGSTAIDGGMIRTGEIRSNTNVTVGTLTQPAWSINLAGNMQINDALIRGTLTIGSSGDITSDQLSMAIKSWNYSSGISGWAIKGDGSVEFANGIFRGTITALSGVVGGWTIGATSLTGSGITLDAANGTITGGKFQSASSGYRLIISPEDPSLYDSVSWATDDLGSSTYILGSQDNGLEIREGFPTSGTIGKAYALITLSRVDGISIISGKGPNGSSSPDPGPVNISSYGNVLISGSDLKFKGFSMPRGIVAFASGTAPVTLSNTDGVETTILTLPTIQYSSTRRYKITARLRINPGAAGQTYEVRAKNGSTILAAHAHRLDTATGAGAHTFALEGTTTELSPSTPAITLVATRTIGASGAGTVVAGNAPHYYIMVEDVGAETDGLTDSIR